LIYLQEESEKGPIEAGRIASILQMQRTKQKWERIKAIN